MICTRRRMARLIGVEESVLEGWMMTGVIEAKRFNLNDITETGLLMDFGTIAVTQCRVARLLVGAGLQPTEVCQRFGSVARLAEKHGIRPGSLMAVTRAIGEVEGVKKFCVSVYSGHFDGTREEMMRWIHDGLRRKSMDLERHIPGAAIDQIVIDLSALYLDTCELNNLSVRQFQVAKFPNMEEFEISREVLRQADQKENAA